MIEIKGCGKRLHYSIKSGSHRYCGLNLNAVLYLCPKCKKKFEGVLDD